MKFLNKAGTPSLDQNGVILKGITTSRVEQALKGSKTKGNSPYPARVFLKEDCTICLSEKTRCWHSYSTTDTPVFFRIKDEKGGWIKPKIKRGSYLKVEGYWSFATNSPRLSFTAYKFLLHE